MADLAYLITLPGGLGVAALVAAGGLKTKGFVRPLYLHCEKRTLYRQGVSSGRAAAGLFGRADAPCTHRIAAGGDGPTHRRETPR